MKALCLEKLDGVYHDGESTPSSPDSAISSEVSVSNYELPAVIKRRKQVPSKEQDCEVEVEDELPATMRRKDISSSEEDRTVKEITCNKNVDVLEELKHNVVASPPTIASEKATSDNNDAVLVVHEQREEFMFLSPVNG